MEVTNWRERVAELRRGVLAGDLRSTEELGLILQQGIQDRNGRSIVRRNTRKGFELLRQAAERGDPKAAFSLGNAYGDGLGTRRSDRLALRWYRRAARHGMDIAAGNIASTYRQQGKHRLAFRWWRRAASLGDGDASLDLGYCYQYGIGVRRSVALARRMYRRAIASDHITPAGREDAMYHLAVVHLDEGKAARAVPLLIDAGKDGDFQEAASLLAQIRSGSAPAPCRCRRWLSKDVHPKCPEHLRKPPIRRRLRMRFD